MTRISRRRFIGITAATAGLALLPAPGANAAEARVWRGTALGASATIRLYHPDPAEADRLITASVAEIARLERVFSLQRPDSALSRLNRAGALEAPPADLARLLSESAGFSALTAGAFDPTVQPLWELYAGHFGQPDADPAGPAEAAIREALSLVDWRAVQVDGGRVGFAKPGMAVTLNGVAQGYITDRVVERLRAGGVERVLADLGEARALGGHPDGSPWRIGLENPRRRGEIAETLEIESRAVATSGGYGTVFEPSGRFNHLFDPASGHCGDRYLAVSVVTATATAADALSTAFTVMPLERMPAALAAVGGGEAHVTTPDGRRAVVTG